jgi:hypothetical protein
MICFRCGHYSFADGEMQRTQMSGSCSCRCHPWNQPAPDQAPVAVYREDGSGEHVSWCPCGPCVAYRSARRG